MLYLWGTMLYSHRTIFASELKSGEIVAEFLQGHLTLGAGNAAHNWLRGFIWYLFPNKAIPSSTGPAWRAGIDGRRSHERHAHSDGASNRTRPLLLTVSRSLAIPPTIWQLPLTTIVPAGPATYP